MLSAAKHLIAPELTLELFYRDKVLGYAQHDRRTDWVILCYEIVEVQPA